MKLAPIAMFVYKRPQHALRTIEALKRNDLAAASDLIVVSDGPKTEDDRVLVDKVRADVARTDGFRSVTLVERECNYGLAESIISGVTDIVNTHGRIIVLEDDMVTSPYFLRYMNEALDLYENDEDVISIHGYVYPVKGRLPETFFLRGADCWGWATWKRGWALFEPDGGKLLIELKEQHLEREFDFNGAYPYTTMLRNQIGGRNDSWAIRWYASAFLKNKLTLYPGTSLVHNIGLDASGTHCGNISAFDAQLAVVPVYLEKIAVKEDKNARAFMALSLSSSCSLLKRIWRMLWGWS